MISASLGTRPADNQLFVDDQPGRREDRVLHDLGVVGHFFHLRFDAQGIDCPFGQVGQFLAIFAARAKYFDGKHISPYSY